MFGRQIHALTTSPSVVAPTPDGSNEPRTSEQGQKAVPAWLLPWMMPLLIVLVIVVGVVGPGFVVAILGLVAVAGLGWLLLRAARGRDYSDLTRNDRFLKDQDRYEMSRNDRFDRDR
jgi:hypothetical protein